MKKIRLAIDANEANVINRVGSNVYAYRLITELYRLTAKKKNWQITVLLSSPKLEDLPKKRKNWQYILVTPKKLWTQWALPLHLFFHKKDYDLFFTPGHYAPRISSVPYVSSVMDLAYLHFPKQFRQDDLLQLKNWTKYSVKNARKVLTISQFSKTEIVKHYHKKETDVLVAYPDCQLPKAANLEKIKKYFKEWEIKNNYLLYLGTIQPRKNLIKLLEAYEKYLRKLIANQKSPGKKALERAPQLVIAGKIGWLADEFVERVKNSPFSEKVVLTGFIPDEMKAPLYRYAKASFLLSFYEGFGIPPLESIRSGCIPIVANNSSLVEVVGKDGVLVNPERSIEIASAIWQVTHLKSRDYQKKIKKLQKHTQQFSWEKSGKILLKLLKEQAEK